MILKKITENLQEQLRLIKHIADCDNEISSTIANGSAWGCTTHEIGHVVAEYRKQAAASLEMLCTYQTENTRMLIAYMDRQRPGYIYNEGGHTDVAKLPGKYAVTMICEQPNNDNHGAHMLTLINHY